MITMTILIVIFMQKSNKDETDISSRIKKEQVAKFGDRVTCSREKNIENYILHNFTRSVH